MLTLMALILLTPFRRLTAQNEDSECPEHLNKLRYLILIGLVLNEATANS